MRIVDAFNYGMAIWGRDGTMDREPFERVVEIDRGKVDMEKTANLHQCLAIAYWAMGEVDIALGHVSQARQLLTALRRRSEFSCWRYLQVGIRQFESDLDEIRAMIGNGEQRVPRFMADTRQAAPVS